MTHNKDVDPFHDPSTLSPKSYKTLSMLFGKTIWDIVHANRKVKRMLKVQAPTNYNSNFKSIYKSKEKENLKHHKIPYFGTSTH